MLSRPAMLVVPISTLPMFLNSYVIPRPAKVSYVGSVRVLPAEMPAGVSATYPTSDFVTSTVFSSLSFSTTRGVRWTSPSCPGDEVAGPPVGGDGGGPCGSFHRPKGTHHRDPCRDHLSPSCPVVGAC